MVPYDDKQCPMCPMELRNLFAVAHNLTVSGTSSPCKFYSLLAELKRAVEQVQPLVNKHFENPEHSHGRNTYRIVPENIGKERPSNTT